MSQMQKMFELSMASKTALEEIARTSEEKFPASDPLSLRERKAFVLIETEKAIVEHIADSINLQTRKDTR